MNIPNMTTFQVNLHNLLSSLQCTESFADGSQKETLCDLSLNMPMDYKIQRLWNKLKITDQIRLFCTKYQSASLTKSPNYILS